MKKLLLALFILIGIGAAAQYTPPSGYTNINQRYDWLAGLFRALGVPAGGTAAFQTGQAQRAGAIYYDSTGVDSGLYVWSGLAWRKTNFGDGANIYNSDGVLTGNRILGGGGFNLTINNVGLLALESTLGTSISADAFTVNTATSQQFTSGNDITLIAPDSIILNTSGGKINIPTLTGSTDTTTFKPFARNNSTGEVRQFSYWPGGGGGDANLIIQNRGIGQSLWDASGDTLYMHTIQGLNGIDITKLADSTIQIAADTVNDLASKDWVTDRIDEVGGSLPQYRIAVGDASNNISSYSGFTYDGTKLENAGTSVASTGEVLFKTSVSDDAAGYFQIANSTSANSVFSPIITGNVAVNNSQPGLFFLAQTTAALDNSATTPLFVFDARRSTPAALTQRPIFQYRNFGTSLLEMAVGGQLGIGVTGPTEWLQIKAGTTGASPIRLTSGTNTTTARTGAIEYNGTEFFMTATASNRRQVVRSNVATPANGQIPIGNNIDFTLANITSTGGSIAVTNGAGTINLEAVASATAINDIGDATAAGLVTVGNNSQQWDFTGLTGSGLLIQSNTTAATNNLHKPFRVLTLGANASSTVRSFAAEFSNSHTGTTSTNVGLSASATNGTNNHAIIVGNGNGNVGFGTDSPVASALLEMSSTTQGFLMPRMTTSERNAISSPATGLRVFDTDYGNAFTYNGTSWFNEGVPNYNNQTGTTYTLLSSDAGKILTFDNASDITLTVPTGLPVGFTCTIIQLGAGEVIFTASSTTINNRGGFDRTNGQYAMATVTQRATNTFVTGGDMQ